MELEASEETSKVSPESTLGSYTPSMTSTSTAEGSTTIGSNPVDTIAPRQHTSSSESHAGLSDNTNSSPASDDASLTDPAASAIANTWLCEHCGRPFNRRCDLK
jgi:hypothetical protein